MSKQSAEALVLLEQLTAMNYKVSIEARHIKYRMHYTLTVLKFAAENHSHYYGDTFIDAIMTAAKAEKLI